MGGTETAGLDPAELRRRVLGSAEQAEQTAREVGEAGLGWLPPGGGWSVGQVLEHLVTTDREYVAKLRPVIAAARARGRTGGAGAWRPSLLGGMLARAIDPASTKPVPSPKSFRPAGPHGGDVVARFRAARQEIAALMDEAAGLDLRRVRLGSPVSRLIRLNLGDAFLVLTLHAERHLGQIERVRSAPGFPAAAAHVRSD